MHKIKKGNATSMSKKVRKANASRRIKQREVQHKKSPRKKTFVVKLVRQQVQEINIAVAAKNEDMALSKAKMLELHGDIDHIWRDSAPIQMLVQFPEVKPLTKDCKDKYYRFEYDVDAFNAARIIPQESYY